MTALVADVGGSSTKLAEVGGRRVLRAARLSHRDGSADLRAAVDLLRHWRDAPLDGEGVATRSGWALPGVVSGGVMRSAHDKVGHLLGRDLGAEMADLLGLPVVVDNDARAAGLGEFLAGAGRGAAALLTFTLGTGVGTSVVVGGRAVGGSDGHAGILGGHQRVDPRGRRCTCGGTGCLEAQASGWALPHVLADLRTRHPQTSLAEGSDVSWPSVLSAARDGDGLAIAVRDELVQWWSVGVANAAAVVGADRVVLTGGMAAGAEHFVGDLRRRVTELAWAPEAVPQIVVARDVWSSALLGMAELAESTGEGAAR